jgi:hypothetical protein
VPVEDEAHLDPGGRITDPHTQQEAIELRLRKGKRPCEILWVLRCNDEKRLGQGESLPVERHLPLVHCLEQCRLRARAGPVDFVGKQNVREYRTVTKNELSAALVVDADPEDIARKEVACELHATKLAADCLGERPSEGGLADAGNVLDEQVPARQ